ncbi:MAG: DUF1573 domain-containing protein [Bacteroidetes bacterium]|nr:DUF1573 domain-containing protein [Bacteroidota bacterium]
MKALKSLLLVSTLFLMLPSVFCQNANPNAPQMTFKKTVHDFGNIYEGGNGNCDFPFTNDGKEPLIIISVKSSCGCTIPEYPQKPILPGQTEVIKVKYDTQRQGPINRTVTIVSNAKNQTVMLQITGTVIPKDNNTLPEKKLNPQGAPMAK